MANGMDLAYNCGIKMEVIIIFIWVIGVMIINMVMTGFIAWIMLRLISEGLSTAILREKTATSLITVDF